MNDLNTAHHCDWMENGLPDKSVQLIIADPPYFEVKGDFDFVWASFEDYLKDVERWAIECKRVLADNGTLFWWGDEKRLAYSQIIMDKHFSLLNSMVWHKWNLRGGAFGTSGGDNLRSFPICTERILMYSNEIKRTGLEVIKLDMDNFRPLREYFKALQEWMGEGLKAINLKLGHRRAEHAFYHSSTQWDLPTLETYDQLITAYGIDTWDGYKSHEALRLEYEALRLEYEALRLEYEALRRPFNNEFNLTELLVFNTDTNLNHETPKPEKLTRALILTCSRPNDLVLVPFAGSGTECAMAEKEGRRWIGFDVTQKYVDMTNKRADKIRRNPTLF